MRKYRINATSTIRIEYGIELYTGLSQFDETLEAATEVQAVNDALATQYQIRLQLHRPVLNTRAILRFAEYNVDRVIRSTFRAAEIADGGRRGRISNALFPDGLTPVIRPSGRAQVKPTKQLIERLKLSTLSGIDVFRTVWLSKLEAAQTKLESAITGYESARDAHDQAFRAEMALRDAHWEMIDRVMGLVRSVFPLDKDVHDVIFPIVTDDSPKRESSTGGEIEKAPVSVGTA
jgi:hypothetical protein